ncbi:MAG: hypothetical protein WBV06_04630 [Acidimicrobiia bacterium]
MTEFDRLARRHAQVLKESVADATRPELMALSRSHGSRRGWLVAAVSAVVVMALIAPFAWRSAESSPASTGTRIGDLVVTTGMVTTSTLAATTSDGPTGTPFDLDRFVASMLDGAFGSDEDRIGMVVLVPSTTAMSKLLEDLPELDDYRPLTSQEVAAFADAYAEARGTEPLHGDWQAYGLIPQYSGTPVWEWEPALRAIPEAVFAANLDFVNSEIRIPDGWSVLAKEDPSIPSGSIRIAINAGLVVINSTATTIIDPAGAARNGEPSPAPLGDGGVDGYPVGDTVLLLDQGGQAWLLDVATVSWRQVDSLPPIVHPVGADIYPVGLTKIANELFVVIRARVSATPTSEVVSLDLATGTWRVVEPVPSPISRGGVTTDGTRLIVGGVQLDTQGGIVGGRKPVLYEYTDAGGWSELPTIPIEGLASTITWLDGVGLLAWNYDLESALLDENGTWRKLDNVPMETRECLPTSMPIARGAAGFCGGLAWFDGETLTWEPIEAPREAQFSLSDEAAYAIVTTEGNTTLFRYPLPPAN